MPSHSVLHSDVGAALVWSWRSYWFGFRFQVTRTRGALPGGTVKPSPTLGGCDAQQRDRTGSTTVCLRLVRGFGPLGTRAPAQGGEYPPRTRHTTRHSN